jgi:hypothetical protein
MSKLKSFQELLPLATVALLFLSFLRLKAYYGVFGLNIIPSISVSEIIKYVLESRIVIPFIGLMSIYLFILSKILRPSENSFAVWKIVLKYGLTVLLLAVNIFVFLKMWKNLFVLFNTTDLYSWIFAVSCLCGGFITVLLTRRDFVFLEERNWYPKIVIVSFYIVLLLNTVTIFSVMEASEAINNKMGFVRFDYEKKTISSTDSTVYIGRVEEYVFLFNTKRDSLYQYEVDKISNYRHKVNIE